MTSRHVHHYAARLDWSGAPPGGLAGYASYDRAWTVAVDGKPPLHGSAAATFRGDPARHDPEDLFLAALASCHMLAYLALCARAGVRVLAYADEPRGTLALDASGGGRFTSVALRPMVEVASLDDVAAAERLHAVAHERCFIASSCHVAIACEATVRVAAAVGA